MIMNNCVTDTSDRQQTNKKARVSYKPIRDKTNAAASSIAASREVYRTIGAQGWQKHCRNWKSNDGCQWRVNDRTTFR